MNTPILLNVTRTPQGRLAVFDRHGATSRSRAGDALQLAGALTADLDHPGEALEYAFEAGNTPQDLPQARTYRSWSCRSVPATSSASPPRTDAHA